MATQGDETDEEYPDDPIKLIDFEQKRINTLKKLRDNCQTKDHTDSDVDFGSDSVPLSKYKRVCHTLPASFFTISKNVKLLNECQPVAIELVDCIKHSSCNKKKTRRTNSDCYVIIVDDEESVENACESDLEDCVVISDSEKEESDISLGEQMAKPKIRPVDITSYMRSNQININNSVQRTSKTLKPNEKVEKYKGELQNKNRVDFKKNKGLIGIRIVPRANVDDRSKTLVEQKIVERVNVDKTKDRSNVEIEKSNKVAGKTIQSSKPVHHDVNTLKVNSKSKLLDSNTTGKSVKQPESNLVTFNDEHSIMNKESLRPNNTNSSKVYKETEKPSSVREEINLTTKHDKQKSSRDTSEKHTKNVETNKTKNNKEKECISKYFKDVWDKDLRLALEPDTIELKKRNSLKYFKDKLKIDKRKSRKKNTKRESKPAKLDTDNNRMANNNKGFEKIKKTTKDSEKSKKEDSIVTDNTKKDSTHNKSMPSLLLGEQIATGKSQIENNVSSKSTNKKKSEKLSQNKCMGIKEKSDFQPIPNPKNRDIVVNEKSQTSCKDSSKLVMNKLATQNKVDKKAERNKNSSEKANLGSSIVNYNLNRDVIDKDKPMSTSTGNNRINSSVMYKDKTSPSIPTAVNKQLQADRPLTSKPTATQQTINQNNSHPLHQKQNEDLYNEDRKKSECLAKYLFYLQSLNPNIVGGDLSLKHAVKPQECILSYVNGNQQEPKDKKIHTFSIGDFQKSSNSTGNNTSSATGPINSQQIPNEPINKGLVPPAKTMPNNSTNDCNKPDAVKKCDKTFDVNMTNSSLQDIPPNSILVKKIDTATSIKPKNSTNDCNKTDAVKKSDKTFDVNMNNSSMQDIPPNSNLVKKIDTATSIKTNNSTNDCNNLDVAKKSDKTFDVNMTNSAMQDIPPNSNLVKEIDTATSIKSEVSIKQEDPSESSCLPPMNPAQQTACQGRVNEECGEPIKALVIHRKDYHKDKLGIAPQVNMKTVGNLNTFPHGVIHCAPICHGAPQNMPQGDQNQFGFYHPPQGKHISHAQPLMSLPVPQMSQPLPQMSQSSPKILQHSQQMSQPSQQMSHPSQQMSQPSQEISQLSSQISQPSRQMPQTSRQLPKPSQQMPQPSQQMSQSLPKILQHSRQISQSSPQISQPSPRMPPVSRQMPQQSQQMPQPSQQMPLSLSQMSQPSRRMPQPSQHISQPSQQISQLSPQISQPSRQMPQTTQQMPQPSQHVPQPSLQMPPPSQQISQPSHQISQPSQQMLQHSQQMLQPLRQIRQPSRQMPQPPRQMPQPSRKMPQPSQQVPQTSPEILQHLQQMSQTSLQISQPSPPMPQPSRQTPQPTRQMPQPSRQMPQHTLQMPQPSRQVPQTSQPSRQVPQTSPEILQHLLKMSQPSLQISQPSRQMPQPSRQMPQSSQQVPQTSPEILQHLQQMSQPSLQISQPSRQMPQPSQQLSRPPPQMSCQPTQMCHSTPQMSPQFKQSTPQMSHNAQLPLWYPPPQMPPRSSQMYRPVLQNSHSHLRMTPPRQHNMSNCGLRMSYSQAQNVDLYACEKCQIDFPQMSHLPPHILHPPSGMLNRHQQIPHFLQCLSNAPPQISHPLPTSSHTHEQTWNPAQQLSNPQSQISHLPQQMSNTPPQMPNPTVKYDNVAQSVSGSTIIGRNNDGVVRKINITAAHSKGLPSTTETKLNNNDDTPLESEQEMFEELCKITTFESPIKEDSKSKKDLKRQLSKDNKIDESTPNRRPRISPMLKKFDDALQGLIKSSEPVPQKGYSPPILPIATFEKTFEILAQANIELSDNRHFEPIKIKWNPILRKRRCLSVDERRDNARKISIDEYKKRSTGKDDKAIDFVVQHRKDDQNGGQNPDQDLGYDSDTTMKQ